MADRHDFRIPGTENDGPDDRTDDRMHPVEALAILTELLEDARWPDADESTDERFENLFEIQELLGTALMSLRRAVKRRERSRRRWGRLLRRQLARTN